LSHASPRELAFAATTAHRSIDATESRRRRFGGVMDGPLLADLATDLDANFERLVLGHQDRLYTIALRLLGDPRDAEEVAQDAFVRAYRALASYEPIRIRELRLRPWLATIAINVCRNRARRKTFQLVSLEAQARNHPDEGGPGPVATSHADQTGGPLEATVRHDSARQWAALLASLPTLYRAPIVLRHVDGLSYEEMSGVLGRPEGTLKAQVHRGLALLRDAYRQSTDHDRQEMTA
jgi:RNA polymerase sigma-70 factor (ECF subfamily)